jgi:hypothetical protein
VPPLARRRCSVPVSNSMSDHCRPHNSEARKPCRKATRIIVASRWPHRLRFAASISFSTSRSVRCSRGRIWVFGRRNGVTVRFAVAGDTSSRCDLPREKSDSYQTDHWSRQGSYRTEGPDDFGTRDISLSGTFTGGPTTFNPGPITVSGINIKETIQTVKFGINYRFWPY